MGFVEYAEAIRFWSMVNIGLKEHCWEYLGYINNQGYGKFPVRRDGKQMNRFAHKVAFYCLGGPIPAGLCVRHKCDNRRCCNPAHLELGTHQDNMNDMKVRGRAYRARGSAAGRSKLAASQVLEIRELAAKLTQTELAWRYGVCRSSIRMIVERRSWSHI